MVDDEEAAEMEKQYQELDHYLRHGVASQVAEVHDYRQSIRDISMDIPGNRQRLLEVTATILALSVSLTTGAQTMGTASGNLDGEALEDGEDDDPPDCYDYRARIRDISMDIPGNRQRFHGGLSVLHSTLAPFLVLQHAWWATRLRTDGQAIHAVAAAWTCVVALLLVIGVDTIWWHVLYIKVKLITPMVQGVASWSWPLLPPDFMDSCVLHHSTPEACVRVLAVYCLLVCGRYATIPIERVAVRALSATILWRHRPHPHNLHSLKGVLLHVGWQTLITVWDLPSRIWQSDWTWLLQELYSAMYIPSPAVVCVTYQMARRRLRKYYQQSAPFHRWRVKSSAQKRKLSSLKQAVDDHNSYVRLHQAAHKMSQWRAPPRLTFWLLLFMLFTVWTAQAVATATGPELVRFVEHVPATLALATMAQPQVASTPRPFTRPASILDPIHGVFDMPRNAHQWELPVEHLNLGEPTAHNRSLRRRPTTAHMEFCYPGGDPDIAPPGEDLTPIEGLGGLMGNPAGVTDKEKAEFIDMLKRTHAESPIFAYSLKDMPGYSGTAGPYQVTLKPGAPTTAIQKERPLSALQQEVADEKHQQLLDADIVEKVPSSPFVCNPVIAAKRDHITKEWTEKRYAHDLRQVNELIENHHHQLPDYPSMMAKLAGKKVFCCVDLRGAFHQLPVHPDTQPLLTYWHRGQLYRFKRMPFGVKTASQCFQHVMEHELHNIGMHKDCLVWVDDLLIMAENPKQLRIITQRIMRHLSSVGLRLHPEKSIFLTSSVHYLGHQLTPMGLSPHQAKIAAISALEPPCNKKDLQSALGLMNYYMGYCEDYSALVRPLTMLTGSKETWHWGPAQQEAWDRAKYELTRPGKVLFHYNPDPEVVTRVHTDWSARGFACVLGQVDPTTGRERPVALLSRSCTPAEAKYPSTWGEAACVVWALRTLKMFLHGRKFELYTDHSCLVQLMGDPDKLASSAHQRWVATIQDFDFVVVHRPGSECIADYMSRHPMPTYFDPSGSRITTVDPRLTISTGMAFFRGPGFSEHGTSNAVHIARANVLLETASLGVQAQSAHQVMLAQLDALRPHVVSCASDIGPWWGYTTLRQLELQATVESNLSASVLTKRAAAAVRVACLAGMREKYKPVCSRQVLTGTPDAHGVRHTECLDVTPVGPYFCKAGLEGAGVVLVDLFGGLASGLEAALRVGLRVKRYIYVDCDDTARTVAQWRVEQLVARYPDQLSSRAVAQAFHEFPGDVAAITTQHLVQAGARDKTPWFIVCGWPCQDLSPAGAGAGLVGARSSLLYHALRVVGAVQQLAPQGSKPAYLMENYALRSNWKHERVRTRDADECDRRMGPGLELDAPDFGSLAHRHRSWWHNFGNHAMFAYAMGVMRKTSRWQFQDVLGAERLVRTASRTDRPPRAECNVRGNPVQVAPTFTSFPGSRAFRGDGDGVLYDQRQDRWVEPDPVERCLAMGYDPHITLCPYVSAAVHHAMTGACFDLHTVCSVLAVGLQCARQPVDVVHAPQSVPLQNPLSATDLQSVYGKPVAWLQSQGWSLGQGLGRASQGISRPIAAQHHGSRAGLGYTARARASVVQQAPPPRVLSEPSPGAHHVSTSPSVLVHAVYAAEMVAQAEDAAAGPSEADGDVWVDAEVMAYLQHTQLPPGIDRQHRQRIVHRAKRYIWTDGQLLRKMPGGGTKIVPAPADRPQLIESAHITTGHWGVRRTKYVLCLTYYWFKMGPQVRAYVKACRQCDQFKAAFTAHPTEPIQRDNYGGLFFSWGVDLMEDLPVSTQGYKHALVCVEHFSRHVECVPLRTKTSAEVAEAFLTAVLARYGSSAQVTSDGGPAFKGEFQQLLEECFIDHRVTSPYNPRGNAPTERMVRTLKGGLIKMIAAGSHGGRAQWPAILQWVLMGYRMSPSSSTNISPYELLYAQKGVIPPAPFPQALQPIDFSSENAAQEDLARRAAQLKERIPAAAANAAITAHRRKLRWARQRGGGYIPRLRKFIPGDLVYVKLHRLEALQMPAAPTILRVHAVDMDSGVLSLIGKDGKVIKENVRNCAPCFLPLEDEDVDYTLARPDRHKACETCLSSQDDASMLLCDHCPAAHHYYCVGLMAVPEGSWACPSCRAVGRDATHLSDQQQLRVRSQEGNVQRRHQQQCEELAGRWVCEYGPQRRRGRAARYGQLTYLGMDDMPECFLVTYQDGGAERMTLRKARNRLMPEAFVPPADEPPTAAVAVAEVQKADSSEGPLDLSAHVPCPATAAMALCAALDFTKVACALDPCVQGSHPAADFQHLGVQLLTNAVVCGVPAHMCKDSKQAGFYDQLRKLIAIDVIVTHPSPGDIAQYLQWGCAYAQYAVCLWLPRSVVFASTGRLRRWLCAPDREDRLLLVQDIEMVGTSVPLGIWVCLFPDSAARDFLVRHDLA